MKDSFVLYTSQYMAIKELEDEQLGRLFRALFEKQLGNEVVLTNDIKIAFNFINNQMVIDNNKYAKKCETLRNNAKRGGAPKGNQNAKKQKQPNREKNNLNDNVNDNDNEIILNDNLKKNTKEKHTYGEFQNVLLSDDELEKLKNKFVDYELKIEKLSNYIASKGVKYKSHYATILNWARNNKTSSEQLPNWYGKEIQKKEISEDEKRELEEMLKELEE